MKTFFLYLMRTLLWLLMIGVSALVSVVLIIWVDESQGQGWWHNEISTWKVLILMFLNGIVVPAIIYSTAMWWYRRHTKPSIVVRVVIHVLAVAIVVPWLYGGIFSLIAPRSNHLICFVYEPLALLFLAFLAIGGVLRAKGWDRYCIVRLLLVGAFLTWLRWDEPQPTPRYSWNDIPDPPDAPRAREVLMRIRKWPDNNTFPKIIGSSQAVENLLGRRTISAETLSNSAAIETAWKGDAEYRAVIAQLDTFAAIPELGRSVGGPMLNYLELRRQAQLVSLHAFMKACQGDAGPGVANLVQFYSVVRKAMPHSSSLVSKMIWISCAGYCIGTAGQIAQTPDTKPETLQTLADAFTPLRTEEATLKSAFVGDICSYIEATATLPPNEAFYSEIDFNIRPPRIAYFFLCNPNATVREYLAFMERAADYTATLPMVKSNDNLDSRLEKYFQEKHLKNALGHHFVCQCFPNFLEAARKGNKCKVQSDLLSVYLHQRIGRPLVLNDIFSGAPYLTDKKTGLPFSAGPDGKPGTDDDIRLDK